VEGGRPRWRGCTCCTVNRWPLPPLPAEPAASATPQLLPELAEARVAEREGARWARSGWRNWSPRTPLGLSARLAALAGNPPAGGGCREAPEQLKGPGGGAGAGWCGRVPLPGREGRGRGACYCNRGQRDMAGKPATSPLKGPRPGPAAPHVGHGGCRAMASLGAAQQPQTAGACCWSRLFWAWSCRDAGACSVGARRTRPAAESSVASKSGIWSWIGTWNLKPGIGT